MRAAQMLVLLAELSGSSGPAAPADESLQITLPPASFLNESSSARQGLSGSTYVGCFVGIPGRGATPNVGIWFTHDDGGGRFVGVNPINFEAVLAGYTMVEVQLASGNRTATQVVTAAQAALVSAGFYTDVQAVGGVLTVVGQLNATSAFTGGSYDDAGGGTIDDQVPRLGQILGWTHEATASNSFAAASMRGQVIDPADLPSVPFRITGIDTYWGDQHTGQATFAIYQGGAGAFDFTGATLLGVIGTTTGSLLDQWVRLLCTPDRVFEIDPSLGAVWLVWVTDAAGVQMNFEGSTSTRPVASHFGVQAGTNAGIWNFTGGASGSGATFPATAPAPTAPSAFIGSFRLVIQRAPYYGDFRWKCRLGLNQTFAGAGTSAMTNIFTSNAYTVPNVLGIEPDRTYVRYAAHDAGEQFDVEWWEGGTSDTVIAGATKVWNAGQTSGTATGWVAIVDAGSHPLTPSARLWMSVKASTGLSSIGFGSGGIGYNDIATPSVFYRGAASESEYAASGGESSIPFDPATPTPTPLAPNSTVINNSNAVGLYGICRVPGFAMVAA